MLPTAVAAPTLSAYDAKAMCISDDVCMLLALDWRVVAIARKHVNDENNRFHNRIDDVKPSAWWHVRPA